MSVRMNGGHSAEYNFGEGVIIRPWGPYQVVYHEKDHVGSVRVATNQHGDVLERNDYYPFGMRHNRSTYEISTVNHYQFNGKDKEPYGLTHLSDYGARRYDSQLGRWNEMDPLREKYYSHSPFSFSGNNPVINVDFDGRDWYSKEEEWEDNRGRVRTRYTYEYNENTLNADQMNAQGYTQNLGKVAFAGGEYLSLEGGRFSSGNHSGIISTMEKDFNRMGAEANKYLGMAESYLSGIEWSEGMKTTVDLGTARFVIPSDATNYVSLGDKDLYNRFGTHILSQGQSLKYHPINVQWGGTNMMLIEWLAVPSLIPVPNINTKIKYDREKDFRIIDYYRKAGIIK